MCTPAGTDQNAMYANRYQQMKKLGMGSYGTAFLVHDTKSKHERKVLKAIYVGDVSPNESLDAEREASLLSRLRHPNIVRFYDSFIDATYFCIVTEYCEDGDLDQCLKALRKQRSRLEMAQVIDFFIQLLSAVEFIHKRKILHRDIKSSNIFLKRNRVKLGDFGVSRLMMNTLDKASTFIGTPFYMSPETLRYDGYNTKSDIWSLGCVLYELSVCKRAFERPNILQTMEAIIRDPAPPLPERFSSTVQNLYSQILSKDPDKRLTASALLAEFNKIEVQLNNTQKLVTHSLTPDPELRPPPPDLHRSFSNSPLINKHLKNSLQVPASPIHSASSMESVDSLENAQSDDIQGSDTHFDAFSSTAKEIKTDFYRSKAQELIGAQNFTHIYDYLHDKREEQLNNPAITDDIILSGLESFNSDSYACTLINQLVLNELLNEMTSPTISSS